MKLTKVLVAASMVIAIAVLGPVAAFGKAHGTDRPFKARGSGVLVADPAGTYVIDGTEQATHMGRVTFHVDGVCTNADCSTSTFTTTTRAANGDTVTDSSTSTANGPTGFTNLDTVTGGTGRFAGASGSSTTTGTVGLTSDPLVETTYLHDDGNDQLLSAREEGRSPRASAPLRVSPYQAIVNTAAQ